MTIAPPKTIAVLDFGGQYTHLIARRLRNLGVYSAIFAPETFTPAGVENLVGVVLSGGPQSVVDDHSPRLNFRVADARVPILGLCYGHQLLATLLGGKVVQDRTREYGMARVACVGNSPLLAGLGTEEAVWMSHGDHVAELPPGGQVIASTEGLPIAGFAVAEQHCYGLQFHPEVSHTEHGDRVLENFVTLCTPERDWQAANQIAGLVERIRARAGNSTLFLLASGGVDSLVALRLCIEAVGSHRVVSLHVDTGFMRLNESAEVMAHLRKLGFANLHIADASQRFFRALQGVTEPEEKRHIIGRLFVEVLSDALADLALGDDWLLVQGTIYPDTIESGGSDKAATIKTHHNRVAEIEALIAAGKVVEPLDHLYKDEVRELGLALGLPPHLVNRHPFPGPGLAIRILCSDGTPPSISTDDAARLSQICHKHGLRGRILPVRSVGVQGDSRTYEHPAILWCPPGTMPDWDQVQACAIEAANTIASVNRAVFAIEELDSVTLSVHPQFLDRAAVAQLQLIDARVRQALEPVRDVWQVPVVSLPLHDGSGRPLVVIRPVTSRDAMTADFYRMPFDELAILAQECRVAGAGLLALDVTTKPPGTIEWE
jgi:GMP synthase (glutamine-hydrolysing)